MVAEVAFLVGTSVSSMLIPQILIDCKTLNTSAKISLPCPMCSCWTFVKRFFSTVFHISFYSGGRSVCRGGRTVYKQINKLSYFQDDVRISLNNSIILFSRRHFIKCFSKLQSYVVLLKRESLINVVLEDNLSSCNHFFCRRNWY